MYLSTSTSTEDLSEMYLSTFQVLYQWYLSTDVLKYKVLLPGSGRRMYSLTNIPTYGRPRCASVRCVRGRLFVRVDASSIKLRTTFTKSVITIIASKHSMSHQVRRLSNKRLYRYLPARRLYHNQMSPLEPVVNPLCPPGVVMLLCPPGVVTPICPPDVVMLRCPPGDVTPSCPLGVVMLICPAGVVTPIYPPGVVTPICPLGVVTPMYPPGVATLRVGEYSTSDRL